MIETIRVSCASLCRVEHQGRFFLLLNANRRRKGIYILSPIGGALMLHDLGCLAGFEAVLEDPAKSDLRLVLPLTRLPLFRDWFYSGAGREQSPFRELYEELVLEAGLLPALKPEDIESKLLWTVEEQTFTERRGQTGLLTHYFLEVHDVRFKTGATLGPLLVPPPESGAAWVDADLIERRGTVTLQVDGASREVRVNGYLLLHNAPPPPRDANP